MLTVATLALFGACAAALPSMQLSPVNRPIQSRADQTAYWSGSAWPPEANVRFRGWTSAGPGCPSNSVRANFTGGGPPSFFFPSMKAETGPGAAITKERLNCQINIDLLSDNWQYRVVGKDSNEEVLEAHVKIEPGIDATYKNTYYFSGSQNQVWTSNDSNIEDSFSNRT